MNEYQMNPDVCPSSLDENGLPMTPGETDHVWDDSTDPITCSECGAQREPLTREKALGILSYILDYYMEGADHETNLEVIEAERYIVANLK